MTSFSRSGDDSLQIKFSPMGSISVEKCKGGVSQLVFLLEAETASRCVSPLMAGSLQAAVSIMSKPATKDPSSAIPFGLQRIDWSCFWFSQAHWMVVLLDRQEEMHLRGLQCVLVRTADFVGPRRPSICNSAYGSADQT